MRNRIALGVVLLPLAVTAVRLGLDLNGWHPTLDHALIELHVRDLGHEPVLMGPFSREGWNHPGPALFYLLVLPYRLTGSRPAGLLLGSLAINGAAIAGIAFVVRRRGGPVVLLLALTLVGLLVRTLGVDFLTDPWNPFVTVLPFALFLFLCWDMACGRGWSLPLAAAVGSFLVQSHLGYAPVTGVLGLFGAGCLVTRAVRARGGDACGGDACGGDARDAPTSHTLLPAALVTAAVVALLWSPPLVEQLSHRRGNLTEIADYVRHPRNRHSLGTGYRTVAHQLGVRPEWLTHPRRTIPFTGKLPVSGPAPVPVLLVALLVAGAVALRRRWSGVVLLGATVGLGLVVAVVTVAEIRGPLFFYLVRWTWALGVVAALVVAWVVLAHRGDGGRPSVHRGLRAVLAGGLVVVSALNTAAAVRAAPREEHESAVLATLGRRTLRGLPREDTTVLLRWTSDGLPIYPAGLAAELERHGVDVAVDPFAELMFGRNRVDARSRATTLLMVAEGDDIGRLANSPSFRRIARVGDLSEAESVRVRRRTAELTERHAAGRLTDAQYFAAIVALPDIGAEVAVYARDIPR